MKYSQIKINAISYGFIIAILWNTSNPWTLVVLIILSELQNMSLE